MSPVDNPRSQPRGLATEAESLRRGLRAYIRRKLTDPADTEDLVQEVFARILARDSAQAVQNLSGYAFQVADSVLVDHARRRGVRQASVHEPFEAGEHDGQDVDVERIVLGRLTLQAAAAAVQTLPERTRTVFVLHRLEGRRYREIADQLGISVSAVEKHMVRAVESLTRVLGDDP